MIQIFLIVRILEFSLKKCVMTEINLSSNPMRISLLTKEKIAKKPTHIDKKNEQVYKKNAGDIYQKSKNDYIFDVCFEILILGIK
ncbi:hypothetical protein BpHYR1_039404 [Brachionus plicatilis]|uniref:Uncharacterized protein n=1 Tax=Brachionus plicatilis TaxID=10195 RepID=A0A3M7SUI9_BRAPC|nr:hypothetical protein BpHYR1_039404 [Brachionus plicatilis]